MIGTFEIRVVYLYHFCLSPACDLANRAACYQQTRRTIQIITFLFWMGSPHTLERVCEL